MDVHPKHRKEWRCNLRTIHSNSQVKQHDPATQKGVVYGAATLQRLNRRLSRFLAGPPRKTQADVLIGMLRDARAHGRGLALPEIMAVGIAQHGARMTEIRERGFRVENEITHAPGGRVISHYYLRHDPEAEGRTGEAR